MQLDWNHKVKETLSCCEKNVEKMLDENPDLVFYAMAFDCSSNYAELLIRFSTQEEWKRKLEAANRQHKQSPNVQLKLSEGYKYSLRYHVGNFSHECPAIYCMTDNELAARDRNGQDLVCEELMEFFCRVLVQFEQTNTFRRIPKTSEFKTLCSDHDELLEVSEKRLEKVRQKMMT